MSDEGPFEMDPRLRQELEACLDGSIETSLELELALKGDIGAVEHMWREIAEGRANIADRDVWVEHVAKRVVKDVIPANASERPRAALKALGFNTRLDEHWAARRDLEVLLAFEGLDNGSEDTRRALAQALVNRGHFRGRRVDEALMKVVDRLLEDIRKDRATRPPEK